MANGNGNVATLRSGAPKVAVAGTDAPELASHLAQMCVVEQSSGLFRCEATFGNWGAIGGGVGFLYFKRDLIEFGKQFVVKIADATIFDGKIMAMEASFPEGQPPQITVLAEDAMQSLRMTRRTRAFYDTSDASLFRRIASDQGLQSDINLNGPTYKVLTQVNQSDLAFLRERARAIDAEVWIDRSKLHAATRPVSPSPVEVAYGSGLRHFNVTADLATQRTSVTVSGWDVSGKSAVKEDATDSTVQNELDGGDSGASILKSGFGDRKDCVAHTVPFSSSEAKTEAEALFRQMARHFVTGRGITEPMPALKAGGIVNLTKLGPLFSGKYYLSQVKHLFDGTDLWSEFTAERAGIGKKG